jgi:hypothetical protein
MRLAILVCGLMLLASPLFAQKSSLLVPTPSSNKQMTRRSAPRAQAAVKAPTKPQDQADVKFNQQVSSTKQRLQQEERRLQGQFARLQKMRVVALEKQDQKELSRINRLEQQVVAGYQKRIGQILASTQTQIRATQVQVQSSQNGSTEAKQRTNTNSQYRNQQGRRSSQSTPKTSSARSRRMGQW